MHPELASQYADAFGIFPTLQMVPTDPGLSVVGPAGSLPVSPVVSSTDWFALYRQGHLTQAYNFVNWIFAPAEIVHLIQWLLNSGKTGQLGAPTATPFTTEWLAIHGTSGQPVEEIVASFPTFPW